MLWSRGGWRLHLDAPADEVEQLAAHYRDTPAGQFDSHIVGERVYDHPFTVVARRSCLPSARDQAARPPSRRLPHRLRSRRQRSQGGGGHRRPRRLQRETVWDPYHKPDPQYHFDGIMDSLRKAAAHLPRVDAIGGSAAGVYVNNRVRGGSLFRGVPPDLFDARVRNMFLDDAQGLARRAVRSRERRRRDGARRLDVARRERGSRHRARHQHRGRLRHARGQHHVVARRARVRADRLPPRRRRWTSGRATMASARSTSRSRPSAACCRAGIDATGRSRPARATEDGAEARRQGDPRAGRSTRPSAPTSDMASRTSRRSTISATCWSSAG